MISRLGLAISRVFHKVCPDPFVIAIGLTFVTLILALVWGTYPAADNSLRDRAETLLDAWRSDSGIWRLLGFGMQMCLILVTGHALASTKPVRRAIQALANVPQSGASAAMVVCIAACVAGLINWGLGLIVGAELALAVGRSLRRRGVAFHYPLIVAAVSGARQILPESAMPLIGDGISLERTLFSPLNLFVTGGLVLILPLLFRLLSPARIEDMQPMSAAQDHEPNLGTPSTLPHDQADEITIPDRLDRSPIIVWMLAVLLLLGVMRYVQDKGWGDININTINAVMFALGLILHGSPKAYMSAVEDGARDCAGIIVQFPIYAGIMALISASGLALTLSNEFTRIGDANTMPPLMFLAATLVGLFVPSGGAQWGLQGEIALKSGAAVGVDPGVMLMSVAYGDQLANMLQPFWALPLLAITGVRARDIVGYTAVAMIVAGAWMALGLWIF
jgi:short-chain fatty acids transporter